MAASLTEFLGAAFFRAGSQMFPAPQEPFIASTPFTSAASTAAQSTVSLSSGTNLVANPGFETAGEIVYKPTLKLLYSIN